MTRLSTRAYVLDQKKNSTTSSNNNNTTTSSIGSSSSNVSPPSSTPLKTSLGITSPNSTTSLSSGLKTSTSMNKYSTPTITTTSPPSPTISSRFTKQPSIGNLNNNTFLNTNISNVSTNNSPSNRNSIGSLLNLKTPQSKLIQGHSRTGSRGGSGSGSVGGQSRWGSKIPTYQDYVDEELFYSQPTEEDDEEFENIKNLLNSEYSVTTVQQIGPLKNEGTVVLSWKGTSNSKSKQQEEIDEQQQKDQRDLNYIKDTLDKTDQMSKQMIYILDAFNHGLSSLEKDVEPINASMTEWSTTYSNLTKTMDSIKDILKRFDIGTLETKIYEGAKGDYESYMDALELVGSSIDFIGENPNYKSADKTISALKDLKQHGIGELESNFKAILLKISNVTDPKTIPKLPTSGKRYLAIIPPSLVEDLSKSIDLFSKLHYHGFLKEYKDKRSKFLLNSLRKMSPEKFFKQISETKHLAYVKGSHPLISFNTETLRLYQIESDLAKELFGDQYHTILEEIIDAAHEFILEITEPITKFKKSPGDKIFSIFPLLDLFDNFTKLLPDFMSTISVRDGKHIAELKAIIFNLESTCSTLLDFTLDSESKYHSDASCTVDEVTSNMLNYYKRLIEYKNSVEFLLSSNNNTTGSLISSSNNLSSSSKQTEQTKSFNPNLLNIKTFNDLFEKTLRNLIKFLQNRYDVDFHKSSYPIRGNLYLLNNYKYILTSLTQSSNLIDITEPIYHEFEVMVDNEVKKFMEFWKNLVEPLKKVPSNPSKDETKSVIKSHSSFVKSWNDISKLKFDVPDKELQLKLKTEIKSILRTYETFKKMCENKIGIENKENDILIKIDKLFDAQ